MAEMEKPFAQVVSDLVGRGFKGPLVLADGRAVHDAADRKRRNWPSRWHWRWPICGRWRPAALRSRRPARRSRSGSVLMPISFLTIAKFRALRCCGRA